MKIMVQWQIAPENLKEVLERFSQGAGDPPDGVEMLGRWHEMGNGDGFALFDVTDSQAFTGFLMGWADLVSQKAYPVVEDEQIAANL